MDKSNGWITFLQRTYSTAQEKRRIAKSAGRLKLTATVFHLAPVGNPEVIHRMPETKPIDQT